MQPAQLGASLLLFLVAVNQQLVGAWWLFADPKANVAPPAALIPASSPLKAIAQFDLDGVRGSFRFTQKSLSEPTLLEYDLHGLKGNNKFYHVHVKPVPAYDADKVKNNATLVAELCADPATGGHHNPFRVTAKLPPKSAPLDQYEIGDLSGKHGPLLKVGPDAEDHYQGAFTDDKLPMSGAHSIIGRSIVIHKLDGKRWVCASIVETK